MIKISITNNAYYPSVSEIIPLLPKRISDFESKVLWNNTLMSQCLKAFQTATELTFGQTVSEYSPYLQYEVNFSANSLRLETTNNNQIITNDLHSIEYCLPSYIRILHLISVKLLTKHAIGMLMKKNTTLKELYVVSCPQITVDNFSEHPSLGTTKLFINRVEVRKL